MAGENLKKKHLRRIRKSFEKGAWTIGGPWSTPSFTWLRPPSIEKVSASRVEVGSCRVKVFPDGSVTSAIIHAGPSAQVRHAVKMSSGTSPEVKVVTMQWITLETNFYAAALASSVHDA